MKRTGVAVVAALALPAGTLAALTLPAAAAPPPRPAPAAGEAASPAMLAALQRDLGLDAARARARIARDDKASRLDAVLRDRLGAAYAGAWLTADATALTVAVADAGQADKVREAGATPVVVSRDARTLDAVKTTLDRHARPAASAVAGWYVDVATNSVVVLARDTAAARTFVSAALSRAEVDRAAVRVVATSEAPRLLYDVRGGDAYYIGGSRCSVGLPVEGGFVTAGHCGRTGAATTGFNRVAQGSFAGSSFPGNDYAWVRTNGDWTPQPWVNNYSGGNVIVIGGQESAVGAAICRSGSTTGWRCGTVQAKNQTVNYSQGTVTGLTRTNACAEPGDSGGAWLSGQQGQGVTSGGSGNCTTGGTTFFQPLGEILSAYGLTLKTSGGGNPPPPPPPTPGAFRLRSEPSGRCLDVNQASTANGAQLQIWDCHSNANQQFTQNGRALQVTGKCLDVPNNAAGGTRVQIWDCHGGTNQQWNVNSNGTISNVQNGLCLDVNGGGTANGTAVIVWSCHNGANQRWARA
jgi:streptogrisin C